jgi:hypothetical protein
MFTVFFCLCFGASARLRVSLLHTLETQRLSDAVFTNRHAASIEPCPVQDIDTKIKLETVIFIDSALLRSVKIAKDCVWPLAATCRSPRSQLRHPNGHSCLPPVATLCQFLDELTVS